MELSGKICVIVALALFLVGHKINNLITPGNPPKLQETWWGSGNPLKQDKTIRPFRINVSIQDLQDLKYRLEHTRKFTPPLEGIQHQYGINANLLKEIVKFWKTEYNWKEREKYFNKYPQFLTNIQGIDIHFIHVKPNTTHRKILPLLLLHGWPGSVREFFDSIPLLTSPQNSRKIAFEVIVPSLPGFGFSEPAVRPGLGMPQMAVVFKNLMNRLGFEKFYGQGGDWGSVILHHMSVLYPESVLGLHSNFCVVRTPLAVLKILLGAIYPTWFTREDHVDRVYPLSSTIEFKLEETGFLHLQATKPDTIGIALKDSPVGLAAYILEKFITGTNLTYRGWEDGGFNNHYGYTSLLDNVMIYWITGCMQTSMRLYSEIFNKTYLSLGIHRIPMEVPVACARFNYDFYTPDGLLKEIYPNLIQLNDYVGGHFAAFQVPEVLVEDVFMAVEKFELYYLD